MFNRELFLETQTYVKMLPAAMRAPHIFRSARSFVPSGLRIIWEQLKKWEMFPAWIAATPYV